ncbi:DUF1214 domain-containing protein [Denitratisoma oestradiolicum]|uniref:DUF1214 domain-containing protein n=1 Tax=Denitratisoma oestradiolicum TaxID=311182 RepID=A0A6S6Y3P8_9PROT|nr:DUF1214 domain-containing protein [Denitratisoma oestradiolicum]CAB1369900.1 conserved protein of unknown function [Denitratisoma oestradiolicum]
MNNIKQKSVAAWEAFCDQLKQAGSVLGQDATPGDELTQAEGLRKLVRMIRMGLDASLEYGNTDYPKVYQLVTPTTLGEGETSDSHYYQAMIDGSKTYRLHGQRGEAPYMEFTVYAGKIGLDSGSAIVGAMTEADLKVNPDGSYELMLSPDPQPGNWIRTTPEASVIFIRQYSHDWRKTRDATFHIEQVGAKGYRPPLTLTEVSRAMTRTSAYVAHSTNIWKVIVDQRKAAPPNRMFVFELEQDADDAPEMPTGHRFSSGYFQLAEDETLELSFKPAEVPYWGMDTTNYWFETISYADHRSHYNNRTAHYEPDGSVRIFIAPRDPGLPNWIDTKGHLEGVVLFRWSRTKLPVPNIQTRVMKLAELRQSTNE